VPYSVSLWKHAIELVDEEDAKVCVWECVCLWVPYSVSLRKHAIELVNEEDVKVCAYVCMNVCMYGVVCECVCVQACR